MNESNKTSPPTKTLNLYNLMNTLLYIFGLKNIVTEVLFLPQSFIKVYDKITVLSNVLLFIYTISNFASFYTQRDLPIFRYCLRNTLAFVSPLIFAYNAYFTYNKLHVRNVIYELIVALKQEYNNTKIENLMLRKIKIFLYTYMVINIMDMVTVTVMGIIRFIISDEPFAVFVTAWPSIQDRSKAGQAVRCIYHIAACFFILRVIGALSVLLILLLSLTHQYMNLKQYFYDIKDIFQEDLSIVDKENKYEAAYKKGIRQHIITLQCVRKCQDICHPIFSSELGLNLVYTMTILPPLINSDKDSSMLEKVQLGVLFVVCLVQLGISMWNAGDITNEASKLPTAMYSSGWQNCHSNTKRIRRLLVLSMLQAQKPVLMKAFHIVELSCENYVTIIKTSYTIFSVFYSI